MSEDCKRSQILDAAEKFIRQTGGTDFTMREFAKATNISIVSTYNLFGSKEVLLFGLLTRSQKPFMGEALSVSSADPIAQVLEAAENVIDILIRDPAFLFHHDSSPALRWTTPRLDTAGLSIT